MIFCARSHFLQTVLLCLVVAILPARAANIHAVNKVRLWTSPDSTRMVFDVDSALDHQIFHLHKPERVVIDMAQSRFSAGVEKALPTGGVIKAVRTAKRDNAELRVVLDLSDSVKAKSFLLRPNDQYGHRLVIDLFTEKPRVASINPVVSVQSPFLSRDLIIAIDAGHGGEDPGARGRHGTHEKDVVLSIARKLARLVEREKGMRAVLIRDGDYYLGLRKRINRARKQNADLFISIHADAFKTSEASGSSVFILSSHGASSEMARWLAKKENAADLVGGVSLDDKDDLLAEVLLDLAQTATLDFSLDAANRILREMSKLGKVHKPSVQKAKFVVLKSPDIPSILVETAFISNPGEEKRLTSARHQEKIAGAILKGVKSYFDANPQPGTLMAKQQPREYVIKAGDTLSHIAHRYGVSLNILRSMNSLNNDKIKVGKRLAIPADG
ncbi:MAG: N-acetylmuramoyl-L-alanine amidase [Gammaproteobacteria bacterium]